MKYLVDANVLSEATRKDPDSGVIDWLEVHESELVVDSIVLAELAIGAEAALVPDVDAIEQRLEAVADRWR